jgi:hypothetical protein
VPALGAEELTGLFGVKEKWPLTKDPAEHFRRSVYLIERRTFLYPLFAAFDPPEVMTSCAGRTPTVVPTQALALLKGPLARAEAAAFARRVGDESGGDPAKAVARAWLIAFGRPVTTSESARALAFLRDGTKAESALADLCLALVNANEFITVD